MIIIIILTYIKIFTTFICYLNACIIHNTFKINWRYMIYLKHLLISSTLLFTTSMFAKPNLPPPIQDVVKLEKMAGDIGPFVTKENFPKGYFLIPKNLPFLIGLALYHPNSSNLQLSKKQIDTLVKYKNEATPKLASTALKIKKLELEIVQGMALKHNKAKASDFFAKVNEVAKLRTQLTKAHLKCIEFVKSVLNDEQYEELLDYGVVNMF